AQVLKLKKAIQKGLEAQMAGHFSFIEALSTCPTNWRTSASATWAFLEKEMGDYYKVAELMH
ncbi:MAG TPA: 2-oxoglutarate synthase, partial [Bacillota bacterium]|nr:2-oxoglutarate synthase [Bacillota bacterium]